MRGLIVLFLVAIGCGCFPGCGASSTSDGPSHVVVTVSFPNMTSPQAVNSIGKDLMETEGLGTFKLDGVKRVCTFTVWKNTDYKAKLASVAKRNEYMKDYSIQ